MLNVRLKDIAERAGVSMMTVSKALRDAHDISPSTRRRSSCWRSRWVTCPTPWPEACAAARQAPGAGPSNVANPIYTRIAMAIEERRTRWLIPDPGQTQNIPEREDSCILRLLARRVDGLLIAPTSRPSRSRDPTPISSPTARPRSSSGDRAFLQPVCERGMR